MPMCVTCGVQYGSETSSCAVCEDARQYVPVDGQQWTTLAELRSGHTNVVRPEGSYTAIGTEPKFAIGQRALLVPSGDSFVLWDCVSLLDEAALGDSTLIRCGGHFAGGTVLLHGSDLLSGDIVQVIPDRAWVGFMYSFPNYIPLPADSVRAIASVLEPFAFKAIYGAWWGTVIARDGSGIVRRSAQRYIDALDGKLP
jgi:hypothetical protein